MQHILYFKVYVLLKFRNWGESVAYQVKKFGDYRERRCFSKLRNSLELTDLLEVQKKSYETFLEEGIKEVFEEFYKMPAEGKYYGTFHEATGNR